MINFFSDKKMKEEKMTMSRISLLSSVGQRERLVITVRLLVQKRVYFPSLKAVQLFHIESHEYNHGIFLYLYPYMLTLLLFHCCI